MSFHSEPSLLIQSPSLQNPILAEVFRPIPSSSALCHNSDGWSISHPTTIVNPCILDSIVLLVPSAILLVFGWLRIYSHRDPKHAYKPWFYYSKIALTCLFMVLNLAAFGLSAIDSDFIDVRSISPLLTAALAGLALNIHVKEDVLGVPSGVLLLYWLFSIIAFLAKIIFLIDNSEIYFNKSEPVLLAYSIIYCFLLTISVFTFFLEYLPFNYFNIPKDYQLPEDLQNAVPILDNADIFSRFAFTWMNPLIVKATEDELTPEDLPIVEEKCNSVSLSKVFLKYWTRRKNDAVSQLLICLMKSFGYLVILAGVFEFFIDALAIAQPFLLRYLILFAQSYYTDNPMPMPLGFYISFGMFILSMIRTCCRTNAFLTNINLMLSVRGALATVIYKKSLHVSAKARQNQSTGEIVNLMSTDIPAIIKICYMISSIWQAPIKLVMCLIGLYHLLGPSAFVGPALIVAVLPINSYMTSKLKSIRKKQMKLKDSRIKQTTELLTNMKSLKLYGWEPPHIEKLRAVRNKQLSNLRKLILFGSIIDFMWVIIPCLITTSSFGAFVYWENTSLTPEIVFPCLSLFLMMNDPILTFPRTLVNIVNSYVSFERVRDFLVSEEISHKRFYRHEDAKLESGDVSVAVDNCSFGWSSDTNDGYALKNINFEARKGELSCIVGKIGSGKTSFMKALLGELFCHEGSTTVFGKVAYVSQDMWLLNGTLRENILFGHRYNEDFYNLTVEACALTLDIKQLPDGDQTEIGEMGITLSGGQKARVSLARAVYARADVYLFDDPLSAVDEHVSSHVMDKVLSAEGLLATKTRIFATNSIQALKFSDSLVMLQNGNITQRGNYSDITSSAETTPLKTLIDEFGRQNSDEEETETHEGNGTKFSSKLATPESETVSDDISLDDKFRRSSDSITYEALQKLVINGQQQTQESLHKKRRSFRKASMESLKATFKSSRSKPSSVRTVQPSSSTPLANSGTATPNTETTTTDLIEPSQVELGTAKPKRTQKVEEKAMKGHVKLSVYSNYIKACGIASVVFTIGVVIISSADSVTTKFWLKHWSEHNEKEGGNADAFYYLSIYLLIGVVFALLGVARKVVVKNYCGLNASTKLHDEMLLSVTRSPMQFFETTPIGRIINRFSGDVVELDESLPSNFLEMVWVVTDIFISVAVIVYGAPMVMIILFPLIAIYSYYQKYYAAASRVLKRLLVISRSPIYSHFQETLTGSMTIRAFGQIERFEHINSVNLDYNMRAIFLFRGVNRWLSMRQQIIGSFLTFATAIFVTFGAINKSISPGLIGVVMGYSAVLSEDISYFIKIMVSLETSIIAVERILEYCGLKSEAVDVIPESRPEHQWPQEGAISFNNYSTKYRENLDLILKNITIDIKPHEKVGVVGRTGAGKSSLVMALFRIIEPVEGSIVIDGTNTTSIGLRDLRTHLSIIPQDSQIFGGTIRQNLDPMEQYTDEKIWEVLKLAHLSDFVTGLSDGLSSELSEGGSNISAGQKQLICLGRALLHNSAILVLDEATASVDVETDKLIQDTIRTSFKHKTIVTIAHRLNTIMDSDRILVLENGQVAEFDTPTALLADQSSFFYSLCKKGGLL